MRTKAPATLTKRLTVGQKSDVSRWWEGLTHAERVSLRVVGRYVEARQRYEDVDEGESQSIHFYEYLVNHELSLEDDPKFRICSAHPEARRVIEAGEIPAEFRCPLANTSCPMRAVLDREPGCDVRLSLVRAEAR